MRALTGMTVSGLFDRQDVHLDFTAGAQALIGDDRLSLIYGRNGSGKSTLLRLLFHGVSSDMGSGHRTSLVRLPFREAEFNFSDGAFVRYERLRRGKRPLGLSVTVSMDGVERNLEVEVNSRGVISLDEIGFGENWDEHSSPADMDYRDSVPLMLHALQIDPVIITDSHQVFSDLLDEPEEDDEERYLRTSNIDRLVNERRNEDLRDALARAASQLRMMVFRASTEGTQEVDQLYEAIVRSLVAEAPKQGRPNQSIIPNLRRQIDALKSRAAPLLDYGLISAPSFELLDAALAKAPDRIGQQLRSVLGPYLDGLDRRFTSMGPAHDTISVYIETINDFLEGKRLDYASPELHIVDWNTPERIDPADLSSGEKALLVLFSYMISLRHHSRLFIIDEPEISLNPDWQRKLIPSLLRCVPRQDCHVVIATHSIEMLAPFDEQVQVVGVAGDTA